MNIPSFITSSADPEKISLTIKSIVAIAILFGFDSTLASQIGTNLTTLIVSIGTVISVGTALWGLIRKIKFGRWSAPKY